MPGGDPLPAEPYSPDPDLLRRRERLDVLVRIGFWTTASSVVVLLPMCMGCGFLMPAWAAPLVFLPAPIVFVLGGSLFIMAQVLANRVRCDVCPGGRRAARSPIRNHSGNARPAGAGRCRACRAGVG